MLRIALLAALQGLTAASWACSKDKILQSDGNVCCNAVVEAKLTKLLASQSDLAKAAVAIRDEMESSFGDHWEAIIAYEDFGYASYRKGLFHCKVTAPDGKSAMVWKVFSAGGGGGGGGKKPSGRQVEPASSRPGSRRRKPAPRAAPKPAPKPAPRPPPKRPAPQARPKPKPKPQPKPQSRPKPKPKPQPKQKSKPKPRPEPKKKSKSAPKKKSKKKKKKNETPNQKLMECCKKKGKLVPKICYDGAAGRRNVCNYNSLNGGDLLNVYVTKSCPMEALAHILLCASEEEDHRPCCRKASVPGYCDMFCNPAGGLRQPTPQQLGCVSALAPIRNCFIHYSKTGTIGRH